MPTTPHHTLPFEAASAVDAILNHARSLGDKSSEDAVTVLALALIASRKTTREQLAAALAALAVYTART